MELIIEEIKKLINDIADIEIGDIDENSAVIDDLDMNSLEILSMIAELEKTYSMNFLTNDLRKIITVKDIAEYIWSRTK